MQPFAPIGCSYSRANSGNRSNAMTEIPGTRTLLTSLGHRITVFANDFIGKKIARVGLYEKESLEYLNALLARIDSPVVLDIGANIGNHSLAFATQAAVVHAFEPLPDVVAVLEHNVRQNGLENIHVHPYALSDENSEAELFKNRSGNVGGSSFDRGAGDVEAVRVPKRVGDEVVGELGLDRIDLIKMDVEAHEAYVLKGLTSTLRDQRPFITMEWAGLLTVERLRDSAVMRFLEENYTIHVLGTRHERMYWEGKRFAWLKRKFTCLFQRPYPLLYDFDPERLYLNLLLVPKGREELLPEPGPAAKAH